MTLDSLIKAIKGILTSRNPDDYGEEKSLPDNADFDPENPFPELVVIEFSDVMDLHSIPPAQIPAVVDDYLGEAHDRGVRFVRIVHGRGIGVQRERIRSILQRTEFVEKFSDAPLEAGGWGATIVTLRVDSHSSEDAKH